MAKSSAHIRFDATALKLARLRAGLTQARLAHRMQVTLRTVQLWEAGNPPNAENFRLLVAVLGISPDDLYVMGHVEREREAA